MNFTERSPIEDGFATVFHADIKPKLQELEFDRQAVARKTLIQCAIAVAAIVLIGLLLLWSFGDEEGPLIPVLIGVGGGYFAFHWIRSRANSRWRAQVKDIAIPTICAHLGELTHSEKGENFSVDTMVEMKLLPDTDYKHRNNLLRGSHNGTRFSMVHARFANQDGNGRSNPVTDPRLFKGLLFKVDLPTPAPGRIALIRDRGALGNKLAEKLSFGGARSMPKVAVSQVDLEEGFEVYAENPEKAQAYLSDNLVNVLLRIGYENGQGMGAKSFTAGFDNDTFYLALRRDSTFSKVGDLNTPVGEVEDDLHNVFDTIALVYHVIDRLNLAFAAPDAAS
ncbi:DUF3137 domain-containing protein [Gymnodinialimonas sp. 57CJ19]|uniref:DUF3137 domain-containing protein n=1 Tax=Gymnodinialimonas sp. 57CJ19 TaxID=3138498 RepID=UPI003134412B